MRAALGSLLAVCMLFLSGCAPRSQKTLSKTPEELDATARSFVLSLASGKYDETAKIFSKEMTAAMPVSKLGELWSMLLAQGGPWRQIEKNQGLPRRRGTELFTSPPLLRKVPLTLR